jgi:hypothetical protein
MILLFVQHDLTILVFVLFYNYYDYFHDRLYIYENYAEIQVYMHPLVKNHFSKCQKILKKFLSVHLDILCSLTKFCEKKDNFCDLCKKDNFLCSKIAIYVAIFLSFLHRAQKMFFHTKTLVDGHRMFRCIPNFFIQIIYF